MMFTTGPRKGRWLEISGSGQVHPDVVRNFGFNPDKTIGFAFGSGLERLASFYEAMTCACSSRAIAFLKTVRVTDASQKVAGSTRPPFSVRACSRLTMVGLKSRTSHRWHPFPAWSSVKSRGRATSNADQLTVAKSKAAQARLFRSSAGAQCGRGHQGACAMVGALRPAEPKLARRCCAGCNRKGCCALRGARLDDTTRLLILARCTAGTDCQALALDVGC